MADLLYRVLTGRPATVGEQAELHRRARAGASVMDLSHELKATSEGARVIVHGIAPALRTYLRSQFDDEVQTAGPRLVFIHIMKVGGTSLCDLFSRWVPSDRAMLHAFADDFVLTPTPILGNLRIIAGHLPYTALSLIPPPFGTMTVLRDPFSRTLSHYSHMRSAYPAYRGLSLEQFVFDEVYELSGNYQARQLAHQIDLAGAWTTYSPEQVVISTGGDPMVEHPLAALFDSGPIGLDDNALLATARANLDSIDIVGITENLDRVAAQAAAYFGQTFESIDRLNVSPKVGRDEISDRIRRRIDERTAIDRELYDQARRRSKDSSGP